MMGEKLHTTYDVPRFTTLRNLHENKICCLQPDLIFAKFQLWTLLILLDVLKMLFFTALDYLLPFVSILMCDVLESV